MIGRQKLYKGKNRNKDKKEEKNNGGKSIKFHTDSYNNKIV